MADSLALFEDIDKFNNYMEKFKQDILLSIPTVVVNHIQNQHKYKKIVDDFYIKYPELAEEKVLIGSLANKIAAENPSLSSEEVFTETGKQAKEILGNMKK